MLEDTTIHNAITDKALASYFRSSGNLLEEESKTYIIRWRLIFDMKKEDFLPVNATRSPPCRTYRAS